MNEFNSLPKDLRCRTTSLLWVVVVSRTAAGNSRRESVILNYHH